MSVNELRAIYVPVPCSGYHFSKMAYIMLPALLFNASKLAFAWEMLQTIWISL